MADRPNNHVVGYPHLALSARRHGNTTLIGHAYTKLEGMDVYGYLPLMASYSTAHIGALNAESFCERVLSCANVVLTSGNTLLRDEEIEMLVVLRMNEDFMEFMRAHYPKLAF